MPTINVQVYDDEGVSQLSVKSIMACFVEKMRRAGTIVASMRTVNAKEILANSLSQTDVFIMPGGADLPYCAKLNGEGNTRIREFVANGKLYIGICAGGYYGSREVAFKGDGYDINEERELALFAGRAVGSIAALTGGQYYDEKTSSKAAVTLKFQQSHTQAANYYYHGGAYFLADPHASFEPVATYKTGKIAMVSGNFEKGSYFLSGVHYELCPHIYHAIMKRDLPSLKPEHQLKELQLWTLLQQSEYGTTAYRHINNLLKSRYLN